MNIPSAESHKQYDKAGCLQKLCGRGFPYLHQWKRRYCVLSKGYLFVYENEDSKSNSKNTCVVDLKYFDNVTQALQKESKKASNVFVISSQDKTFFDQGRHLFSAATLTDMHEWMTRLKDSMEQIRNNNRQSSSNKRDRRQNKEVPQTQSQPSSLEAIRPIDSTDGLAEKPPTSSDIEKIFNDKKIFQILSKETIISEVVPTAEDIEEVNKQPVPKKRLSSSQRKISKVPEQTESKPLESMTKNRVKGPSGRRAPQNRKTISMKQRASSMSALQPDHNSLEEDSRIPYRVTHSDLLEEEISDLEDDMNLSHQVSAYHYSSDEDVPIASNLVREIEGLRVLSQTTPRRRGSPPLPDIPRNEDLLEYRSLPKNLRKRQDLSHTKGDTLLMKLPTIETYSSSVKLSSGRASPEMDALDNLLMSQSVCPSNTCHKVPSEGSDGSTCKQLEDTNCQSNKNGEEILKALENCSGIVQQLQHHSTDLEIRTSRIENELSLSRKDVASLYDTSAILKNDVEKLAKAVSIISEEASTTHKDMIFQRKPKFGRFERLIIVFGKVKEYKKQHCPHFEKQNKLIWNAN